MSQSRIDRSQGPFAFYVAGWKLCSGDLPLTRLEVGASASLAVECIAVEQPRQGSDHRIRPTLTRRGGWRESVVDVGFPAIARTPANTVKIGAVIPGDFWLTPLLDTDIADLAHPESGLQEFAPLLVQTWLVEAIEEQYAAYGRRGEWEPVSQTRDRPEVEKYLHWVQATLLSEPRWPVDMTSGIC
jgi:hypothetical protein